MEFTELEEKWDLLNQTYEEKTNELKKQSSTGEQHSESERYVVLKKVLKDCSDEQLDYIEFKLKMELSKIKKYPKFSNMFPIIITIIINILTIIFSILSSIVSSIDSDMLANILSIIVVIIVALIIGGIIIIIIEIADVIQEHDSTQKLTYLLKLIFQEQCKRKKDKKT